MNSSWFCEFITNQLYMLAQALLNKLTLAAGGWLIEQEEMASKRPFSEEDFSCPVCCDIFSDPVLLQCGHSVCRCCIQQYWTTKGSRECPLCRKRSTTKNPPVNLALKNLSLAFLDYRGPSEELCEVHRERLSLFCLHDEALMCVVCRESHQHRNHACRPVSEIAEERKVTLCPGDV